MRAARRGKRGLIPARAGKTIGATVTANGAEAHPRAGGENTTSYTLITHPNGSSPRGRGKPCVGPLGDGQPRLIPARAGKTCQGRHGHSCREAHPRAGGENGSS